MAYFANKSIVVPFDFSKASEHAVDTALEISGKDSALYVVHVIDPTPVMISVDPALPVPQTYDEDRQREAEQQLQQQFAEGPRSRFGVAVRIGDPGSEIISYANGVDADLIVMPSHGRTGLRRLLIGSVAERVLRLASCPVLVLRDGDE